jgi:triacylglycerol lipase
VISALGRLSPQRRRFHLTLAALALLLVAVPLGRALLDRATSEPAPVAQDAPGPVLLVPGYGGSTASLRFLEGFLAQDGREVLVVEPVGDGTGDLREQAEALRRDVEQVLQRSDAPSVDLVGYSAGGVVVRLYLDDLGGTAVTRRAVTLGSPHHGTDLAALAAGVAGDACPEACRQLAPDSDLLLDLNRGDETPDGPAWTAIWTEDDEVVVPGVSGRLDGALSYAVQDVCPGLTVAHGDLPRTAPTILMVAAALGVGAPEVPGASVCDAALSFAG